MRRAYCARNYIINIMVYFPAAKMYLANYMAKCPLVFHFFSTRSTFWPGESRQSHMTHSLLSIGLVE